MPTFVYMTRCDGCGHCVDICPSDIMHIDKTYRRAMNIEPNMCWECYSCVKACPQNAIDDRGYADFAPLGHSVRVRREEEKGTISCLALIPFWSWLISIFSHLSSDDALYRRFTCVLHIVPPSPPSFSDAPSFGSPRGSPSERMLKGYFVPRI